MMTVGRSDLLILSSSSSMERSERKAMSIMGRAERAESIPKMGQRGQEHLRFLPGQRWFEEGLVKVVVDGEGDDESVRLEVVGVVSEGFIVIQEATQRHKLRMDWMLQFSLSGAMGLLQMSNSRTSCSPTVATSWSGTEVTRSDND
ncbi:hypothetical protein E2C01_030552 [Portunus trituberculatus]|uniref:Uncharacterized protein n=1 Tax=Portunus trituberculatus TaxID=210409 RepID=A0A5B7EQQ9_PORTR|nr:hypothetical protein [Portunus trituberculatus]